MNWGEGSREVGGSEGRGAMGRESSLSRSEYSKRLLSMGGKDSALSRWEYSNLLSMVVGGGRGERVGGKRGGEEGERVGGSKKKRELGKVQDNSGYEARGKVGAF